MWLPQLDAQSQDALLRYLAMSVDQSVSAEIPPLWRVHKNGRELRCVLAHFPTGLDVRLDGKCRLPPHSTVPGAHALADKWRAALAEVGWTG